MAKKKAVARQSALKMVASAPATPPATPPVVAPMASPDKIQMPGTFDNYASLTPSLFPTSNPTSGMSAPSLARPEPAVPASTALPDSGDGAGYFGLGKMSQWNTAMGNSGDAFSSIRKEQAAKEQEEQKRASEAAAAGPAMLGMIQAISKRNQENRFRTNGLSALAGM